MIKFRYKIIAKIEALFIIISELIIFAWIVSLLALPLIIQILLISVLFIFLVLFSKTLITQLELNENGITVKQLFRRELLIAFDDILHIYIIDRDINEQTALFVLYNKKDVYLELAKLRERTLFLELIDSAGIAIKKLE